MRSIPTMNWSTAVTSRYSRMKFFACHAPLHRGNADGSAGLKPNRWNCQGNGRRYDYHPRSPHPPTRSIDAPESQQTCRSGTTIWHCGRSSPTLSDERLSGYPVSCHARAQDRYGRTIAVCTVSGEDINAWLVSQGWALAYRKYSLDYTAHEDLARSHRRGIWSSEFIPNPGVGAAANASNPCQPLPCHLLVA